MQLGGKDAATLGKTLAKLSAAASGNRTSMDAAGRGAAYEAAGEPAEGGSQEGENVEKLLASMSEVLGFNSPALRCTTSPPV